LHGFTKASINLAVSFFHFLQEQFAVEVFGLVERGHVIVERKEEIENERGSRNNDKEHEYPQCLPPEAPGPRMSAYAPCGHVRQTKPPVAGRL
jgi:hypothetical protein